MKNAVCITIKEKGMLDKETLIRETARTMGFKRTGNAIVDAVEKAIEYGEKKGELF